MFLAWDRKQELECKHISVIKMHNSEHFLISGHDLREDRVIGERTFDVEGVV